MILIPRTRGEGLDEGWDGLDRGWMGLEGGLVGLDGGWEGIEGWWEGLDRRWVGLDPNDADDLTPPGPSILRGEFSCILMSSLPPPICS